jgi:sugar lactone lactonase YvrE
MKSITLLIASLFVAGGCTSPQFVKEKMNVEPTLFADLGETFSVPDGMAADTAGNIVLSVPNYLTYEQHGAKIVMLDRSGNIIHTFSGLTPSPSTGKVHPMGIAFGPDENLYIADNQFFTDEGHKSRVLRLIYKDGKPLRCEVVVEGTELSNAVRWQGDWMYLTDTVIKMDGKENQSGVYRFHISELEQPLQTDKAKHLLVTYTGETGFGADGLCFDADGNMYCGLFGDGQVFKTSFNADGSVKKTERIINDPAFECCDGITCDRAAGKIYMTNSQMNSVWVYTIKTGAMQRLWQNPDDTGATGLLDQPCEPLLLDNNTLLVVNFDMTFPGLMNRENDDVNSISKFELN